MIKYTREKNVEEIQDGDSMNVRNSLKLFSPRKVKVFVTV